MQEITHHTNELFILSLKGIVVNCESVMRHCRSTASNLDTFFSLHCGWDIHIDPTLIAPFCLPYLHVSRELYANF